MKRNALATIIISSFLLAAGPALAAKGFGAPRAQVVRAAKGYAAQPQRVTNKDVRTRGGKLDHIGLGMPSRLVVYRVPPGGMFDTRFKVVPPAALMPMVPKQLRAQQRDTRDHAEDRQLTLGETSVMTKKGKMPLKVVLTTNNKRAELALVVGEVSGVSPSAVKAQVGVMKGLAKVFKIDSARVGVEIAKAEAQTRTTRLWGRKLSTTKNPQNQMKMLDEIDGWLQTARMPRPMNSKAWVGQLQALLNQAGQNMLLYRQGKLEAKAPDAKNPINYMLADKDF